MAQVTVQSSSWLNLTRLLSFNGYLFWDNTEYPDIPFADQDTYIQLTDQQAKRIDLVAFDQYGDSNLMWILMLANDKLLPNDFLVGETIRVPVKTTIDTILKNAKARQQS